MYRRLLGCTLLMLSSSVMGSEMLPFKPSPSEMALLPEYCKVRATDNHLLPEFKDWMQRIGPKFLSIHHYCAGLNYMNRYQYRVTDQYRKYYLSRAVPEIDYVAKDMPPDFPLAGEIYLNRGVALQLMGKDAAAYADFTRALERDPKQVPAYFAIAEVHEKNHNKSKALEIIAAGLRNVPGNERLQNKYLALGGKKPFPNAGVPLIEKDTAAAELTKPKSEVSVGGTGEEAAVPEPSQNADHAITHTSGEDASSEESGKGEDQKPGIGSPNNPYCRFCP